MHHAVCALEVHDHPEELLSIYDINSASGTYVNHIFGHTISFLLAERCLTTSVWQYLTAVLNDLDHCPSTTIIVVLQ